MGATSISTSTPYPPPAQAGVGLLAGEAGGDRVTPSAEPVYFCHNCPLVSWGQGEGQIDIYPDDDSAGFLGQVVLLGAVAFAISLGIVIGWMLFS